MTQKTCGPLYKEGLDEFAGDQPEDIRIFAAGFITGQAEKIFLGACRAAMFRPSAERFEAIMHVVSRVAMRYDLVFCTLETSRGQEIWLCRDSEAASDVFDFRTRKENSAMWHQMRGLLCGIPPHKIDANFHERAGYGERCD